LPGQRFHISTKHWKNRTVNFIYLNIFSFIFKTLNERSLSLIGIENVDGKNTYLLELTPLDTNNEPFQWKSKIWVDRENWMLLRSELYDSRENVNLSMEIRDMKLNSGIPDSEFEFKIPDGAQVKVLGPEDFKSEPKKLMQ